MHHTKPTVNKLIILKIKPKTILILKKKSKPFLTHASDDNDGCDFVVAVFVNSN